jgi:pimeloyl-ACP methyl ester carboxylesterase
MRSPSWLSSIQTACPARVRGRVEADVANEGDYDPRIAIAGSGEPVVLVPGMDGTGELFYRQVPLLARSYRVATYALRDDTDRMDVLADDLAGVIEHVAPAERSAIVVGESFGGTLAMSLAIARPQRVRALVVLNSFPYFAPRVRLHLALAGLRVMPWGMMGLVRRATAAALHSGHTHRQEMRRFLELTQRATRQGYLNRLRILTRYDVRPSLPRLGMPVLFLAAEHDHLVPSVKQAVSMAARVPGAAIQILDGHGHICLIAPDLDLAEILRSWRPHLSSGEAAGDRASA